MVMAYSSGQMEECMKVNIMMIKKKVMEYLSGKIVLVVTIFRPDGRKYVGGWLNGK